MPNGRKGRGGDAWRYLPRPTVADRKRSDEMIANRLTAVTAAAAFIGIPALCAAIWQAVVF